MIGKRLRSLPFIFANDNYTLSYTFSYPKYNGLVMQLGISRKVFQKEKRRVHEL